MVLLRWTPGGALPIAGPGDELVIPPAFGARCALCWEVFRLGDSFKSVWPKGERGESALGGLFGISVHAGCFAQLEEGDLTRIFAALRRRLTLPIAVLRGRRVER